jgi:hypothetical protein
MEEDLEVIFNRPSSVSLSLSLIQCLYIYSMQGKNR